jgi:galactonate dehydratase
MSNSNNLSGKTGENKKSGQTRRQFMGSLATVGIGGLTIPSINNTVSSNPLIEKANDSVRDLKITRIRWYKAPSRPMTNQSFHVVTVETDKGITGIGEGGTASLVSELAQLIIGENPLCIENLWQLMYRSYFYPPGREKIHALGALDMALWDIKGKVLGLPLHELLGGKVRNYIETYPTGFRGNPNFSLKDNAKLCMDQGFRAFRTGTTGPRKDSNAFNAKYCIADTLKQCEEIREGIGPDGDFVVDFHCRLDLMDAVKLAGLLEPLNPYYIEDPIRSENKKQYHLVREKINIPLAVGEHYGDKWDSHELIEANLFDHSRITIPNCGGITEYMKIAALAEIHYLGLIPHFTGPIATATLINVCSTYPGPVLMEYLVPNDGEPPHLPKKFDFKDGKMWPNDRPGHGVEVDLKKIELIAEITEYNAGLTVYRRADGSITNW